MGCESGFGEALVMVRYRMKSDGAVGRRKEHGVWGDQAICSSFSGMVSDMKLSLTFP